MATCHLKQPTFFGPLINLLSISLFLSLTLAAHHHQPAKDISADDDLTVDAIIQCLENQYEPPNYPISEVIYTQKHPLFQEILDKRAKNLRYQQLTTRKPLLIVTPKHEQNVPAVVRCAKVNGVKIRTRSGGHDFEGISFAAPEPFVLLDMFNLNAIDVDVEEETAWVQTGATLGEIYYKIAEKSEVHGFPAGVCPSVGAGGHISGGGYGTLMRKYGLSVDNVDDARIVDAKGRIIDRKAMGEDLFWAIRGGGGSSFGVILAWKINLVRVPPPVTVFEIVKDVFSPGTTRTFYKWQEVARDMPNDLFLRIESTVLPNSLGKITMKLSFIAMFLGDTNSLVKIMEERFPELGLTKEQCKETLWIDSLMFWNRFPEGSPREMLLNYDTKSSAYRKIKGDLVKKAIPEVDLPMVWDKLLETPGLYMEWTPYGGRMDEIDESAIAFPHRKGNLYMIFYDIMWFQDEMDEYYMNKSRELHAFMEPYVSNSPRESVLNYVDLELGASGEQYFGDNFLKLVMVKTRVDPTDFFSHQQSIPTLFKRLENIKKFKEKI